MSRRDFLIQLATCWGGLACPVLASAATNTRHPSYPPVPEGYITTAHRYGIPPLVLYGVALQESARLFGQHVLPYPWTLNIQQTPKRFPSYPTAVAALRAFLSRGIRNIDCGLMQVNWGYHADKLGTPDRAMDPYPNLQAGAVILRTHYRSTGNWFKAVGRYHAPANAKRANVYASQVFQRIGRMGSVR